METSVSSNTLYFLEKGTSAPNVVDLISKHRRTHLLLTPITLKDLIEDDDEADQADTSAVYVFDLTVVARSKTQTAGKSLELF